MLKKRIHANILSSTWPKRFSFALYAEFHKTKITRNSVTLWSEKTAKKLQKTASNIWATKMCHTLRCFARFALQRLAHKESLLWDSNPRPPAYWAGALPTKLKRLVLLVTSTPVPGLDLQNLAHKTTSLCRLPRNKWQLWGSSPRPYGLAPEASALDHSAKLSLD